LPGDSEDAIVALLRSARTQLLATYGPCFAASEVLILATAASLVAEGPLATNDRSALLRELDALRSSPEH
jgi:hypothetical protein